MSRFPPTAASAVAISAESAQVLRAANLQKHYHMGGQDLHVLRGIDLEIHQGQWLAVLGASGSGKSTLLHLLGGLDRPDAGEIHFHNENLRQFTGARLDNYRNRQVGFVFQSYHLLPELTALENVVISGMIGCGVFAWPGRRRQVRQHARDLLASVGLGERLSHKPTKLSGGERQRVAIARALINKPALLLADEPTGNLDVETGQQILEIFQKLGSQGQTIIMVTHDVRVAKLAHQRVTLERGQIKPDA
jgi:ABC-type lipoprotein export system ATPase subunit